MSTVKPSYASIDGAKESTPLAPEFRVYIEGVQVPFNTFSISSVYGSLPTCQIILPYMPYLQEIARNYRPKIHIFYTDDTTMRSNYEQGKEDDKALKDFALRVLFIGEIVSSNYSKSKTPFSSSSNISFMCEHKNAAVDEMSMRTAAFSLQEGSTEATTAQAEANAPVVLSNPMFLATQVVQGVDTKKKFDLSSASADEKDPSGVPTFLFDKYAGNFKGMPGLILRLWNIICTDAKNHSYQNDIMQRIYIRLFTNIGFLDGIVGHSLVEDFLENSRAPISADTLKQQGKAGELTGSHPGTALSPLKASFKAFDAFAADIQVTSLQGIMNQLPQSVGFMAFLKRLMAEFFYEVITLNSPVQRLDFSRRVELTKTKDVFEQLAIREGDTIAPAETIVKPVMPIYFSPKCNVLYPRMYSSISVNDAYAAAPSRVDVMVKQFGGVQAPLVLDFRSPPALRQALLDRHFEGTNEKTTLLDTFSIIGNTPAINEMGRGVFPKALWAPGWMSIVANKSADSDEIRSGFKELLTQYADYEYSIAITSTRTGTVEGIFNPYIIAGYPMDIVDPGVYRPSYHAFCTSVTHTVSASGSTSTAIGFTNAISYDELYTVDTPMSLPWLNEALGMGSSTTDGVSYSKLTGLQDTDAAIKDSANRYYLDVLGVGAAFPDALSQYKYFEKGVVPPTLLQPDVIEMLEVINTPEESITLCRRPIQTKPNVSAVYEMTFLDTDTPAFTPPKSALKGDFAFTPAKNASAAEVSFINTKNGKLSSGFNAFLDYTNFKVSAATVPPSTTPTTSSTSNEKPQASTGNNPSLVNSYTLFNVKNSWAAPFEVFKAKYPTVAAAIDAEEASLRTRFSDYPANAYKQLIFHESSFVPTSVNRKSKTPAVGLGQLITGYYIKKYPAAFEMTTNGFIQNAKACALILSGLKNSYKSFTWNDVIVSYNQGEGTVRKAKGAGNGAVDYSTCRAGGASGLDYFTAIFDTKSPRTV